MIFVRPPISAGLEFRSWSNWENLAGDLSQDFSLKDGFRLQGEIQQPDGAPYEQAFWLAADPITHQLPQGEWSGIGVSSAGEFELVLAKGVYRLKKERFAPYHMPGISVDMRTGDQIGVVVTLLPIRRAPS